MFISSVLAGGIAFAQETKPVAAGKGSTGQKKQVIKALYIPLADHYAGIIAYEKYRGEMKHADSGHLVSELSHLTTAMTTCSERVGIDRVNHSLWTFMREKPGATSKSIYKNRRGTAGVRIHRVSGILR